MKTTTCLTLAIAAALIAGCATTGGPAVSATSTAEGADSTAAWAIIDPDNDSALTVDELEQQRAMGLLQDFPNADANRDGGISRTEWDAWWPRMTDHHVREHPEQRPAFDPAR
jgi:hypothetical protein